MKLADAPIWQCRPREITCRHGHPYVSRAMSDATGNLDYTRVDGLVPYTCTACTPHSYAIGVASRYHELITFYSATREQLHEFLARDMSTFDLLRFLGYVSEVSA